jgi:hypothetical protein
VLMTADHFRIDQKADIEICSYVYELFTTLESSFGCVSVKRCICPDE